MIRRFLCRQFATLADLVKIKRALISVSDKTDLLVLAQALKENGVEVNASRWLWIIQFKTTYFPFRCCPPVVPPKH